MKKKPAEMYLTVTDLEKQLRLSQIACPYTFSAEACLVLVGGEWVEVQAVEPRICTGAGPVRALVLGASGSAAQQLVRLEAELRATRGPLQMETVEGPAFSVSFASVRGSLYLYGVFHRDGEEGAEPCRIRLGDRIIQCFAFDANRDRRRGLAMKELSLDDEGSVVRAFLDKQPIVVEWRPWD